MPYLWLTCLTVVLDQLVKWFIQVRMLPWQSISIIKGWFSLTYVSNYGAAFSILQSHTLLLIGVSMGVFVIIWINRHQITHFPQLFQIGLAIALGGALGNFIDRLRLGYVVDLFDLHFWPVFNIADMAIVIGVVLIVWGMFRKERKQGMDLNSTPTGKGVSEEEKS